MPTKNQGWHAVFRPFTLETKRKQAHIAPRNLQMKRAIACAVQEWVNSAGVLGMLLKEEKK